MGPHGAEPRAGVPQNKGGHAVPPNPPVLPFLLSKPGVFPFLFLLVCLFLFIGCFVKLCTGNLVEAALCGELALTRPASLGISARPTSLHFSGRQRSGMADDHLGFGISICAPPLPGGVSGHARSPPASSSQVWDPFL